MLILKKLSKISINHHGVGHYLVARAINTKRE
jgi:hypothetical protein